MGLKLSYHRQTGTFDAQHLAQTRQRSNVGIYSIIPRLVRPRQPERRLTTIVTRGGPGDTSISERAKKPSASFSNARTAPWFKSIRRMRFSQAVPLGITTGAKGDSASGGLIGRNPSNSSTT
jgi:hypothetical protein